MTLWRVLFHGRVQGVGFRATTSQIASRLGIRGYVRNLADGNVEAICECDQALLHRLIEDLRETFGDFIQHTDIDSNVARSSSAYTGFHIRP